MQTQMFLAGVALLGFLLGIFSTGTPRKAVLPPFNLIFRVKGERYHIHHWMICTVLLVIIAGVLAFTSASFQDTHWKFAVALISGYGLQGFFVRDAFVVKGCGCQRCGKRYEAEKMGSFLAKKKKPTLQR